MCPFAGAASPMGSWPKMNICRVSGYRPIARRLISAESNAFSTGHMYQVLRKGGRRRVAGGAACHGRSNDQWHGRRHRPTSGMRPGCLSSEGASWPCRKDAIVSPFRKSDPEGPPTSRGRGSPLSGATGIHSTGSTRRPFPPTSACKHPRSPAQHIDITKAFTPQYPFQQGRELTLPGAEDHDLGPIRTTAGGPPAANPAHPEAQHLHIPPPLHTRVTFSHLRRGTCSFPSHLRCQATPCWASPVCCCEWVKLDVAPRHHKFRFLAEDCSI